MRGYLGLGSNAGHRLGHLRAARDLIAEDPAVDVLAASSAYETAPQGEVLDQPDFLNACLAVETILGPEQLLDRCKRVERALGRAGCGLRHGPRPIDVDLLLLGGLERRSEHLTLPHPELLTRRFVVEPLLELDPQLRLPDGRRLADAVPVLAGQRVVRAGPLGEASSPPRRP